MGWNTKPDGSGQDYDAGLTFNMPAENIVLYAMWQKIPEPESEEGEKTPPEEGKRVFAVTVICLIGVFMVVIYIVYEALKNRRR